MARKIKDLPYANGLVRANFDYGIGLYSYYAYDANGRRTLETYARSGGVVYENTTADYDALGRVVRLRDAKANINYAYDANGNRMRIYTSYLNAAGNGTASQDLWYRYDAVNRMVVAKGSLASGVIAGGAAFGYDAAQSSESSGDTILIRQGYHFPATPSLMARLARIVIPDVPHHVTQRGNRRLPVFFSDDDRRAYLVLLAEACAAQRTICLAWCLMDNHIHLILVPRMANGLRATLAEAHRRYSRRINFREGWRGYLFQGRFASYPMDDAHLMAAVRYVENNPVAARMAENAQDWPWSSAASHVAGKRVGEDVLTDVGALGQHVRKWRAMLRHGLEAGDADDACEIETRLRTGRPLADADWIGEAEERLGRPLGPARRGPKPKG